MRVLLDTNVLIHREASAVVHENVGHFFNWMDRLHCEKCVHPVSLAEIQRHHDEKVRKSFATKAQSYNVLKAPAPLSAAVAALSLQVDKTENDKNDTRILNELFADRVDALITEDRAIFKKAVLLGIRAKVFTIDGFLEKVTVENPTLIDYKVPSVRKLLFGHVSLADRSILR